MSANSSLSAVCSVNSTLYPLMFTCYEDTLSFQASITSLTLAHLLLTLPSSLFLMWVGLWKRCGRRSAAEPASHNDVLTSYIAVADVTYVLGIFFYYWVMHVCDMALVVLTYFIFLFANCVQTGLHFLTCVERYIAVVHPIAYMRLKGVKGTRIRDFFIVCVFLFGLLAVGVGAQLFPFFPADLLLLMLGVIAATVCYCTFSVSRTLRRPGVGREESKRRAFHTMLAITALLLLRFFGQCFSIAVFRLRDKLYLNYCDNFLFGAWLCVPSSLVLPVLFLQRREMLSCSRRKN